MPGPTEFERGQTVRAHMVGAIVSKVAKVFNVGRGTVSKIYSTYLKCRKTSSVMIMLDMAEATPVHATRPQWNPEKRRFCIKYYFMTARSIKPMKLSCINSNVRMLPPKAEIKTGCTTLKSIRPWIENLNAASENGPRHSGYESQFNTVRNALYASELSLMAYRMKSTGEHK
ncbi:hypothetical protein FHG87_006988 [Trinorchestia longiramus]|nr:hypothetical protein FHG87_006988 [Trinorchestia longiramus]